MLLGAWQDAFGAARMAETLARLGDMASANLPVNLSVAQAAVATEWMVLFGLGLEPHASALLLRRQGA